MIAKDSIVVGAGLVSVLTLGLTLGAGCGKGDGEDTSSTDTTTTETATDSSTDSSTDTSTVTDTTDTSTTTVEVLEGLEVRSVDDETWADWGYELVTYEFSEEHEDNYTTISGERPFFLVYRPIGGSEEPLDLLFWFHGGHIGDDSNGTPGNCSDDTIRSNINLVLGGGSLVTKYVALRNWALILPSSNWCDGGVGLGPDDPVDPVNHWGWVHNENILDAATGGHLGFPAGERAYSWGTSAGATSSVTAAARYPIFDGLIVDSGGCDQVLMHEMDPSAMEHIFGGRPTTPDGEPTEFYQNYLDASCTYQLRESLEVPLFVPYNDQDLMIPATQAYALLAEAADKYPDLGIRYGSHDYDHLAPSNNYHVQTRGRNIPWGYSTDLMMSFLEGAEVYWVEAESGCFAAQPCTVGSPITGDSTYEKYSQAGIIHVRDGASAGVAFSTRVPSSVDFGKRVEAVGIVNLSLLGSLDPSTAVAKMNYIEDGNVVESKLFTAGEFAPDRDATDQELLDQYFGTRLEFTPTMAGGVVTWETMGRGETIIDAVVFVEYP